MRLAVLCLIIASIACATPEERAAKQAAAVTAAIRTAITEGLATRADIADLRTEMAAIETRMTRTLYGVAAALLAGQLTAVLALLRLPG